MLWSDRRNLFRMLSIPYRKLFRTCNGGRRIIIYFKYFQALAAVLLAQVMQKKINITIAIPISTILIMAIFNVQTQLGVRSGTYQQVVLGAIVLIFGIIAQRGAKGVVK